MSTNFSQKERAFVAALAVETGRDLDGWMSAIGDAGLTHRNEIIDWLRQEGFTFAKASWIERIHHNGGKLIYGGNIDGEGLRRKVKSPGEVRLLSPAVPIAVHPQLQAVKAASAKADREIDDVLAAAKAYRPLAQVLLRELLAAVPGADARISGNLVVLAHERVFAAILPGPKDVRLLLGGRQTPAAGGWQKAKIPAGLEILSALTHMLILTDARQLTRELREQVAAAARETAG